MPLDLDSTGCAAITPPAPAVTTRMNRNLLDLLEVLELCSGRDSCRPRREVIAAKMGVSVRTACRTISLAVRLGILSSSSRYEQGRQRSNVYTVHWERLRSHSTRRVDGLLLSRDDRFAVLRGCDFTTRTTTPVEGCQTEVEGCQTEVEGCQTGTPEGCQNGTALPCHFVPPVDPSLDPKNRSMPLKDGLLEKDKGWTWPEIAPGELSDPAAIARRFVLAAQHGIVQPLSEADRLAFFAFARYCVRRGTRAGALFNWALRNRDRQGKSWRAKATTADEDWAREVLRPRSTAHQARCRSPDTADALESERQRQREELRQLQEHMT